MGELLVRRQHRLQRSLGERAVADLATRDATYRLQFTGGERREVVVQHERLRRLLRDVDRVDPLLVVGRAQRDRCQRLRLTAREQRRAVRARQPAHFAGDRANGIEIAAIYALPRRQHAIAHRVVFDAFDHLRDFARLVGELFGQLFDDRGLDRAQRLGALGLLRERERLSHPVLGQLLHSRDEVGGRLHLLPLHLLLGERLHHLIADVEQFLDALVRHLERLDDLGFAQLERAPLDHDDRVARARDREVEVGELELLEGRIENPRALDAPHAHRRDRAIPGYSRDRERRRSGQDSQDIRIILLIRRQHVDEDLYFVLEAFGEERPHAPVDHPGRGDFVIGRPAFTLQKAAGDLAGGVGLLAVFDGQGEVREVRDILGDGDGGQYNRFTELDET